MTVGKLIKKHQTKLGLSSSELAEKLGYNKQFIYNWHRGVSLPPLAVAKRLCETLEIEPSAYRRSLLKHYSGKIDAAFK